MNGAQDSSLARFLRIRGAYFNAFTASRIQNYRINLGLGYGLTIVGLILGVVGMAISGDAQMAILGLGPLLAGAVNVGVGFALRRQVLKDYGPVPLTAEAKRLLTTLMPIGPAFRAVAPRVESLSTDVRLHLERACFQANRTLGILQPLRALDDATATRLASTTERAVDEAMAEVFHHAGLLQSFPESPLVPVRNMEARTRDLEELANRLDRLSGQMGQGLPSSSSTMTALLDELRLQDLALRELNESESKQLRLGDS